MKKIRLIPIFIMLFMSSIIITIPEVSASPIIYVSNSMPPAWYDSTHVNSIATAITNVDSGGTIYIWGNTFNQGTTGITVNKACTIIGNGTYPTNMPTVITWSGGTFRFKITADSVIVRNLNLSGGTNLIDVVQSNAIHDITIENCVLRCSGAGLYLSDDYTNGYNIYIRNNSFWSTLNHNAYAMQVYGYTPDLLDNVVIENNTIEPYPYTVSTYTWDSDGIDTGWLSNATIKDNCIEYEDYWGIFTQYSVDIDIHDNEFVTGGDEMIYVYTSENINIYNHAFETDYSTGTSDVGLLYIEGGDEIHVYDNSFIGTSGLNAIEVRYSSYWGMDCTNVDITSNTIDGADNGIFLDSITNCYIYDNDITDSVNGIRLNADENDANTNITIEDNLIHAVTDYGIYIYDDTALHTFEDMDIVNNEIHHATRGFALNYVISGTSYIRHNNVHDNQYGISISASANMPDLIIYDNYVYDCTYNAYSNRLTNWNRTKTAGVNIRGGNYLGGNWWDDYTGIDTNGDMLGETLTPYDADSQISSGGDYLPLTGFADDCVNMTFETQPPMGDYLVFRDIGASRQCIEMEYIPLGYQEYVDGTIDTVRILVSVEMAEYYAPDTDDYTMVIDGTEYGYANNIHLCYEIDDVGDWEVGDGYWVEWVNVGHVVSSAYPKFAFWSNSGRWYGIGAYIDENVILHGLKYHNNPTLYSNSLYDGTLMEADIVMQFDVVCQTEYIPPNETNASSQIKDIFFKFYDISTGELLHFKGLNIPSSTMGSLDYISALLYSTKTTSGLSLIYSTEDTLKVSINFTEGEDVIFYVMGSGHTDFQGRVNNVMKTFKVYETAPPLTLYQGQTYAFYLVPTTYIDGVNYINCGQVSTGWQEAFGGDLTGYVSLCINKVTYDYGESIRVRYKMPSGQILASKNYVSNTDQYRLKIYATSDYTLFGLTRRSVLWESPRVYEEYPLQFDSNFHTLDIPIQSYNAYGFKTYYKEYEIVVDTKDLDLFKGNVLVSNLKFYVSGETFSPNGTIVDITPNPAYFGQQVTISFLSNGIGHLEIDYATGDDWLILPPYAYSEGLHLINVWMTAIGDFSVELYTNNYASSGNQTVILVDFDTLTVISSNPNETYGGYGFGIPYLYIPDFNYIAGNTTAYIYYRTYKNDSELIIKSPRGETTYFSTTVSNQSNNVLKFFVASYMQIGQWNVTFYCGDIHGNNQTLYSSFNVVNEEGNWIEFTKNAFYTNEPFTLYIKHTYRVALMFYKNNVLQGENTILDVGEYQAGIITIPVERVKPEYGNWRCEMWRINDRNQVYELAEYNTIVKTYTGSGTGGITPFEIFNTIGQPLGSIIGLIITVFCLLIPFLFAGLLGIGHAIHPVIYAFTGGLGIAISSVLGLFPSWLPLFILAVGIIVIVIYWIKGQSSSTGE